MQPSSLIFLVLIAIWAAYLLQHWVRRREHLATARSVDRFSEAMRVLERRTALPDFDLSAPRPRSYAISHARPARQEVVVKRAQPARSDVPTGPADAVTDAAVRPTRIFRLLAGVSARRLRGLSLVVSLLLALVVAALAAFSQLPWWSVLAASAALMLDVVWLRRVAVSERSSARARARGPVVPDRPADGRSAESGDEPRFDPQADLVSEPLAETPADVTEPIELPALAGPSGWSPVPVPPPTYTLKAKAAEPVTVPAETGEPTAVGPWSLDGMVYDCDLDELVERRSATGT
ncbi:MAG TPA: hypothetical protein VIJ15_00270 [Dermatophilaceae bacterium]